MTDVRDLIESAITGFTAVVIDIPDDAWDNPTPCDGWTVRDVVNHVTGEQLWAARILSGQTVDQVGAALDGDLLGDDPIAAWSTAATESAAAWATADLDGRVLLSAGLTPTAEYAEQLLTDLAVHRWDLQRGSGVGGGMDGAVVEHVFAHLRGHPDEYSESAGFGPPVETDSEYAHDQLLARLGRDPFWKAPSVGA